VNDGHGWIYFAAIWWAGVIITTGVTYFVLTRIANSEANRNAKRNGPNKGEYK
jgi:hypothetical protein